MRGESVALRMGTCSVQQAKHPDLRIDDVVHKNVIGMKHPFTGVCYPAIPADVWMLTEPAGLLAEQRVQRQGGSRIIRFDECID